LDFSLSGGVGFFAGVDSGVVFLGAGVLDPGAVAAGGTFVDPGPVVAGGTSLDPGVEVAGGTAVDPGPVVVGSLKSGMGGKDGEVSGAGLLSKGVGKDGKSGCLTAARSLNL
jgi:hypothetical protein